VSGGSWIWGYHLRGAYVEVRANSYREACRAVVARHTNIRFHDEDGQCSLWTSAGQLAVAAVGYEAEGRPSRTGELDLSPRTLPQAAGSARSLGGLALQLYAMLRSSFPVISHLCQREMRWRFSPAAIRDFLANVGAILALLPTDQRGALTDWTESMVRSYAHAGRELNTRRRGLKAEASAARRAKKLAQEQAHNFRRRDAYRAGMTTLNAALDGLLPATDDVVDTFVTSLIEHGYTEVEARKTGAHARRVSFPRL